MSDTGSKTSAPYVPSAAAASERMADSVMSRTTPMTMLDGFQPSEVVQAGLRTRETPEFARPLWGMLPQVKLEPVVSALESALGSSPPQAERPQSKDTSSSGPTLTLVQSPKPDAGRESQSGHLASDAPPPISRTAMEASVRLLDALRAHASAHAMSGGGRVSLAEMQTISFAESRNQLAAAAMNESAPEGKEPDTCNPDFPNPKIWSDQNDIRHKVQELAEKLLKEDEKDQDMEDTRFGDA